MRCHYEVLEISRDADDAEIKQSYRRLALKLHPDKNPDNPDQAKEQFQQVQQAYEVLSDKQERAWYDAHREQILTGSKSDFEDKSLDLFQFFTTGCFKGYSDEKGGFYAVYRGVFEQIAKEDIEFMEEKEEFVVYPGFGRADCDYESVKQFYDFWMGYSTKKSYSWLDPYDVREGKGDRRLLKIIEKENKKVRQKARKERNEEVRNLVAFVRKRDKRMHAFKKELEQKALENRHKQEEIRNQKLREQKEHNAKQKQADWLKFDNVKSELEQMEKTLAEQFGDDVSQSEDEEDFSNLYCVACNKIFKTPKAFENHETSKKHKENVEVLKTVMLEEEEDLEQYDDVEKEVDLEQCDDVKEDIQDESLTDDEEVELPTKKQRKKKKKNIPKLFEEEEVIPDEVHLTQLTQVSDDDFDFSSKSTKKRTKKATKVKAEPVDDNEIAKPVRKQKKGKKDDIDVVDVDLSHCCVTCKNNFPSKNKLFDHLKRTGHGVYIPKDAKKKM